MTKKLRIRLRKFMAIIHLCRFAAVSTAHCILCAAAISLGCASFASAQTLEYKGIPMGASIEEFKASLAGIAYLSCKDAEKDGTGYCHGTTGTTYADQYVLTISADFLEGRLAQVSIETLGGTGRIIEDALTSKYGKSGRRSKVAQTLSNGNKYNMAVTEWKLKDGSAISIQDHPSPHDRVYTALISPTWLAWQAKARRAGTRAKSDI